MDYRPIIESRYNRQNWQTLLHDIFGSRIKFWNTPSAVPANSQFAKQALWLGTITLSDEQTISVYEVELSDSVDIERNRRGIRDMLLTTWRSNGNAGAFMFCYRKNESVLRFSYVSEAWTFADDGTYQKESTDAKRFTYLLGEGHRSRTAIQQFETLRDSALSLKDLTKAFSVDAVSDMFFKEYKKNYEDIIFYITGKRMVKVANKWEERQEGRPCDAIMQEFAHFQNPEKAVRDYVKKLMGRLVFLQFLQKKGWLGVRAGEPWGTGDSEFIQNLFAQCNDKDHFVDNVLEVLFNDLNTEREGDLATPSLGGGRGRLIPYLNGGLFERDASDETNFPLPSKYMQQMLEFFSSYNFTIDENDPDDAEVGVDPEMLGRIFENLLEDNKDKGAFYTPKEIVTYMCRESLIAYLQTNVDDEPTKEAIRQFVTTHDAAKLGTNDKLHQQVDEALKNVKICDPAIGSGAFPMGLLKELFLCRTALEGISQHQASEIKKHIIQQNIYGVDIERGAVDIARLRFWLSLIVDEETPQALPNLDFKIMQGNSLLEQYKGVDLSNITELKQEKVGAYQTTMFDDMLDVLRLDLRKKLDEYYNCPDHKRKAILKQDIVNNVKQQLKEQSINVDFGDLDLSGNNQFMLWHTWFYDVFSKGGFDIVIGNPPYVSVRTKNFDVSKKVIYKNAYSLAVGQYDLYTLFIEQSRRILNNNGALAFIIPTRMLSNENFMAARNFVVKYIPIILYVNAQKPFENVDVEANIMICIKGGKARKVDSFILNSSTKSFDFLSSISYESIGLMPFSIFPFVFGNDIIKVFEKLQNKSSHRLEVFLDITRGFECGYNDKAIGFGTYKLIKSESICPYTLRVEHNIMCSPDFSNVSKYKTRSIFLNVPKLLTKFCSNNISFAIDEIGYCNTNSVYNCQVKDLSDIKYLLAILNSHVTTFWFNTAFLNIDTIFPHIQKNQLEAIPIPLVTEEKKKEISNVVESILIKKRANSSADTSALESEIDRLVYQLYGLTEEEIKIVEENQ